MSNNKAANRLSKSISNVMICVPEPLFIEFLPSDLCKENRDRVALKLKNRKARLEKMIRKESNLAFFLILAMLCVM